MNDLGIGAGGLPDHVRRGLEAFVATVRDAFGDDLRSVVDALVQGLLEKRTEARAAKDFAAADAIRDQIKAAGIEIEDTPDGPRWSV